MWIFFYRKQHCIFQYFTYFLRESAPYIHIIHTIHIILKPLKILDFFEFSLFQFQNPCAIIQLAFNSCK